MPWYKRLRWRLIGVQLFAVMLGAITMFLMWRLFIPTQLNLIVQSLLSSLSLSADQAGAIEAVLFGSLNQLFLTRIF